MLVSAARRWLVQRWVAKLTAGRRWHVRSTLAVRAFMHDIILACGTSVLERPAILQGAGDLPVSFCSTIDQITDLGSDRRVAGAVIGMPCLVTADLPLLIETIRRRTKAAPVLLRFADARALGLHFGTQGRLVDADVSLAGFDLLDRGIARLRRPTEEDGARPAVLSCVGRVVPATVIDIVVVAAIIGGRRVPVAEFAHHCGSSVRRLAERLYEAGVLRAKHILNWSLFLHTMWRITRLGWSAKRAAVEAGFHTTEALSRAIEGTTGRRLGDECRRAAFADVLERYAECLVSPSR